MSIANTYTTFAESFIQLPIVELESSLGKNSNEGYVRFNTIVRPKEGAGIDTWGACYWKGEAPQVNSIIMGWTSFAVTRKGIEFYFDQEQIETCPGDPEDPSYRQKHLSNTPMFARIFGKIIQFGRGFFEVEVVTYIVTGKVAFKARFTFAPGTVPHLRTGAFAGGLGVLLDVEPGAADTLGRITLGLVHFTGGVAHSGSAYGGGKNRASWAAAYSGKGVSEPKEGSSKKTDMEVSPRTTYLDTAGRFMVCEILDASTKVLTIRTVTADGHAHDFDMEWPLHDMPTVGTVFAMHARLVVFEQLARAIPVLDSVAVCPGDPEAKDYRDLHLLRQLWRVRMSGPTKDSKIDEFGLDLALELDGHAVRSTGKCLVPDTSRWKNFKALSAQQIVSARGAVSSITYGEDATVYIDMDHLQNAAIGTPAAIMTEATAEDTQASSSAPSTPVNSASAAERRGAAWSSPTRRSQIGSSSSSPSTYRLIGFGAPGGGNGSAATSAGISASSGSEDGSVARSATFSPVGISGNAEAPSVFSFHPSTFGSAGIAEQTSSALMHTNAYTSARSGLRNHSTETSPMASTEASHQSVAGAATSTVRHVDAGQRTAGAHRVSSAKAPATHPAVPIAAPGAARTKRAREEKDGEDDAQDTIRRPGTRARPGEGA
ncbi:hypothetical protein OC835_006601 [Tilletia horrida]|nr:hypothetical protein OC835_006601 [Tilletia horrida]